jgi:hypothetical protein
MIENQNETQIGEIIFWNGVYGFIQMTGANSIFFHKSNLDASYLNLNLLDEVSFNKTAVFSGKHIGKQNAINIQFIGKVDLQNKVKYIGTLTNWDGRNGIIISTQQSKSVVFYNSRKLYQDDIFNNEDLVVFNQVKSSKNQAQLFALFAYPITREKDLVFLKQAYQDTKLEGINIYLEKLLLEKNAFTEDELFEYELNKLTNPIDQDFFLKLIILINDLKEKKYYPKYRILKKYCSEKYLIQLWEMNIIPEYDISLIKGYFYRTLAENKRTLILKLREEDKEDVLRYYFEKLKKEGSTKSINNNLKTLLDITYRNKSSRCLLIYKEISTYLNANLLPNEQISLWLNGYLESLDERMIIENFDVNNSKHVDLLLSKENEKYLELIRNIFENYFFGIKNIDFDIEFPQIIKRLINFEKVFKKRYDEIIYVIKALFNDKQKFILWIFNVTIEFDSYNYLKNSYTELNDFYKLKFFIHKTNENKNQLIIELLDHVKIKQDGLMNFVFGSPWNELIQPTTITPKNQNECYFLQDIEEFINKYNYLGINIETLSIEIYEQIPKYQIIHLRLWLYEYVNVNFYNYVGFRNSFKFLTSEEKLNFKRKGEISSWITDVLQPEISEVISCKNIISETPEYIKYEAYIENLFFGDCNFMLRKEDGNYTEPIIEEYSSSGLNRIPSTSIYNKYKIFITVSNENKIIAVEGLFKIFSEFHTGAIEKALGKISTYNNSQEIEKRSYTEDWKLRKKIIRFLDENQLINLEPKTVFEPKNFFRRLDKFSGIDSLELTRLYTIKTNDGFGIVWENIDLTEDRATYVFKSFAHSLHLQIDKIANGIVTLAQFRSALLSNDESSEMAIFKSNLGLIGSIRKQRGKNESFENWTNKLDFLLSKPIPNLPNKLELNRIKVWSPNIQHISMFNGGKTNLSDQKGKSLEIENNPKKIKDEENQTIDFNFDFDDNQNTYQSKSLFNKLTILKALQSLNLIYEENVNNYNISKENNLINENIIPTIVNDNKLLLLQLPPNSMLDGFYECEIVTGEIIFTNYKNTKIPHIKVVIHNVRPFNARIENISLPKFVTNLSRFMKVQISTNERGYKKATF